MIDFTAYKLLGPLDLLAVKKYIQHVSEKNKHEHGKFDFLSEIHFTIFFAK